jgi:hypothetical protein
MTKPPGWKARRVSFGGEGSFRDRVAQATRHGGEKAVKAGSHERSVAFSADPDEAAYPAHGQ